MPELEQETVAADANGVIGEHDADAEEETPDVPATDDADEEEAAAEEEAAETADAPDEPEAAAAVQASSPTDIDKALTKIGKRASTFVAFVADTLGDDAIALVQCELCHPQIPGWHFTDQFVQENRMQLSDLQAKLFEVLRHPDSPDYKELPGYTTCQACGGEGKGKTGSHVPGHVLGSCPSCRGFGFIGPSGPAVYSDTNTSPAGEVLVAPGQPAVVEDADAWGSPRILPDGRENPNYGRMPQYKDPTLP